MTALHIFEMKLQTLQFDQSRYQYFKNHKNPESKIAFQTLNAILLKSELINSVSSRRLKQQLINESYLLLKKISDNNYFDKYYTKRALELLILSKNLLDIQSEVALHG